MLETPIIDIIGEQDLLKMPPDASVIDASRNMADRHVGAVLVCENDELLGIITEKDVVDRVVGAGLVPADTILAHIMTPDPVGVAADDTAMQAIFAMRDHGTRHLLVKDGSDIVGIVSVRDLLRSVVGQVLSDQQRVEDLWEGFPI